MGLFDLFSTRPAQNAAAAQTAGLNAGYGQLSDLYGQGRTAATGAYGTGVDYFNQLQASSKPGVDAYADATGANGAEGLARAKGLFTSTPGYTEGINMTLDQNDRRAAQRGMLGSGNTSADTAKLATDYSSQKYGQYTGALQPYLSTNVAGASGAANLYGNLGNTLNNSFTGQGGAAMSTQAGIGNANANADLAAYNASGNLWNALLGGAGLATRVAAAPGSSLFGGLGGAGGGGNAGYGSLGVGPMGYGQALNPAARGMA